MSAPTEMDKIMVKPKQISTTIKQKICYTDGALGHSVKVLQDIEEQRKWKTIFDQDVYKVALYELNVNLI